MRSFLGTFLSVTPSGLIKLELDLGFNLKHTQLFEVYDYSIEPLNFHSPQDLRYGQLLRRKIENELTGKRLEVRVRETPFSEPVRYSAEILYINGTRKITSLTERLKDGKWR